MHHNYDVISGSHTCRYCVWPYFGCRALYNLPWRASDSSHQLQCNIPAFEALLRKKTYQKIQQHMVTCFDAIRLFVIIPILWTQRSPFTLWMSELTLQGLFDWWHVMSQCNRIFPRSPPLKHTTGSTFNALAKSVCNRVIPPAPMPCKTICFVCFVPTCILQSVCVYIIWTSCLVTNK